MESNNQMMEDSWNFFYAGDWKKSEKQKLKILYLQDERDKLERELPIDPLQRGFKICDGVAINYFALDYAIFKLKLNIKTWTCVLSM